MRKFLLALTFSMLLVNVGGSVAVRAADNYQIDPVHTAVTFKISHLALSWTYGRFNDVSGRFTIDSADPGRSSFALSMKPESIDTGNSKRDEHLRGPDFFNVKQFPVISFTSKSVKAIEGGYEVTGDMTLHGATRSITFPLSGGRTADFPPGVRRTGYSTEFKLKRSDFGMDKMIGAVGDEIDVAISFEGIKGR
jgi:polyisoprenoid-binding protein YceI